MNTSLVLRLAVSALAACCAALLLKRDSPSAAFLVTLAFCVAALCALLPAVAGAVGAGRALLEEAGLDAALFLPVLRVLGVSICSRIGAELCRDAGQSAIAAKLELCGAICAVLCALPLAKRVLTLIGSLA